MPIQKIQSSDRVLNQVQDATKKIVDPISANAIVNGVFVTQMLSAGSNVVNHGLGRLQQGWIPTDQNASASFYRTGNFNSISMTIVSSAPVLVTFYCF